MSPDRKLAVVPPSGNGRPDLVVNTVRGTAVWIYKNGKGAKDLSRERLTMPRNATLC